MWNQDVQSGRVQFGKTADDYAKYRPGFPPSFFGELKARGHVKPSMKALDLGTGTGTIAHGLAEMGCTATGLDPAETLLEQARRKALPNEIYVNGTAEKLPFGAATFDLVTAGQCWHWFDQGIAGKEIKRVLKPGGRLIIASFDFNPKPGNLVQVTLDLIPKYNPTWNPDTRPGFFRPHPDDVPTPEGYRVVEKFVFDEPYPFTLESWCGRIRASAGVGASMPPDQIQAFDQELRRVLSEKFPEPTWKVPHYVSTRVYRP